MRRLGAALLAALALALVVGPAPVAGQPAEGSVALASQPAWIGPGGDFDLRLKVERPRRPGDFEVVLTVYPAVASRSEFTVTLSNRATASSLTTLRFPLSSLKPDPSGTVTTQVRVQDPNQPRDPSRVALGRDDGVYPVRVDLREERRERALDRFTTHLVHLPGPHAGQKLGMALILPVHRPLTRTEVGGQDGGDPNVLAQSIEAARNLPVALAPTPETIAGLAARTDERAGEILAALRRVAAERTVLGSSYVPVSLPALFSAGLQDDAANQLDRGTATLTEVLRVQPPPDTWLSDDSLDAQSLAAMARRGVRRLIVSEPQLEPISDQKLTLTESFLLEAGDTRMPAMAADPGLSTHFENQGNQVLRAHQLLADMAVLYLDRPGAEGRALVALPRRGWTPARPFVDALVSGLAQNPIVEAIPLDTAFNAAAGPRGERSTDLVREPADRSSESLREVAPDLRTTRRRLDALATVLGRTNPTLATLERRQLIAESSELRSDNQRQPHVKAVEEGIADELGDIRLPEGRSITLTARRGEIPVTFQNRTGYPAQVVVKVESDKLDFPGGTSRSLDLSRRNTIERFAVVARTSGAFPLRITLESPDGNLVIGRARLTVRSTAAAGVSLFVSLGAAAFLALWWCRHALKGRRSRRLVTE